ncbi:exopolysaccharide biosynthesis protein [Vreelandella populi]|uniref:exopolysaccharide biosynthesis protein n=1 Tax=Vreelandella populi TaxID=2498858 RepID=UPI000F8CC911|nr:exopolysaccharide biosynthesis protein [Halomonas populi]RUR54707.1 exopolysaccharide biosynthesis protein [Halomonas populi]
MSESPEATNLTELIQAMEEKADGMSNVSVNDIVDAVGRRSFGPLLLIAGIITLIPVISGIPGVPTFMAVLVLLVSIQLLARRRTFWLPKWLLNRSVSRKSFDKSLRIMKKPAKWIDSLLGARLVWMTNDAGIRVTALACLAVAVAMPPMELVPFTANGAGVALTLLGLGLVAHDGVVLSLGFLVTGATFVAMLMYFL